ncbi:50S ribosomal protein L29 [Candidatus Woesearchaeota archaeon]|nr:50S ribosomal protein L29 [Candidatus Woesearchaeota archaeon]
MNRELKNKSDQELKDMLPEMEKELMKLNAQVATGTTIKSPGQIKKIKKNIARILTKLNKNTK